MKLARRLSSLPHNEISRRAALLLVTAGTSTILRLPAIAAVRPRTLSTLAQRFTVDKAELDPREYRALVLPNGMRVLLASDARAKKAAAAMNVQVGRQPCCVAARARNCARSRSRLRRWAR